MQEAINIPQSEEPTLNSAALDERADYLLILKQSLKRAVIYMFFFSCIINMLLLVLPMYSLQVFDRVLSSGSIPTLVAISMITVFCFILYAIFSFVRESMLVKISGWIDEKLNSQVLLRSINHSSVTGQRLNSQFMIEANTVKAFLTSPSIFAVFDLPWSFFYMFVIYCISPNIALLVFCGAVILFALTYYKEFKTKPHSKQTSEINSRNFRMVDEFIRHSEVVEAMGMYNTVHKLWREEHDIVLGRQRENSYLSSRLGSISKVLRMTLQIAIIGYGTYLALSKEMTSGGIIACSIIAARALAPIDSIMAVWSSFENFRDSYRNLTTFLKSSYERPESTTLGRPKGVIRAEKVVFFKPGTRTPILKGVDLEINAGDVIGIIGPSGSGKSTLIKILSGIYRASGGLVRIDGADMFQLRRDDIGKYIGYLPQSIDLLRGSIKENISRFDIEASDADVIKAAKETGVHELILSFPQGYDTVIGEGKVELSGGQRQRVALARAFYGDPQLIFLDEPNANLDDIGERKLVQAIMHAKTAGRTVIMISHKPSIIGVTNKIIVIKDGMVIDFGNKDEIMKKYAGK